MAGSYIVEVKPSIFSETSLTPVDFDEVSNLSLTDDSFEEELLLEFTSRRDAESYILSFGPDQVDPHQPGRLRIQGAHDNDTSEVDGYLLFKPFT